MKLASNNFAGAIFKSCFSFFGVFNVASLILIKHIDLNCCNKCNSCIYSINKIYECNKVLCFTNSFKSV